MGPWTFHIEQANGRLSTASANFIGTLDPIGQQYLANGATRVYVTNALGEIVRDSANGDFVQYVTISVNTACPWCDGGNDPDVWNCQACGGSGLGAVECQTIAKLEADYYENPPSSWTPQYYLGLPATYPVSDEQLERAKQRGYRELVYTVNVPVFDDVPF